MIRRALVLAAVGFLLAVPAWPAPAADAVTDWVCSGGSVETCVRQSTDHGYSTDAVTVTAQFRDDDEVIDASQLTIVVNNEDQRSAPGTGEITFTYKPEPGRSLPATDKIYAVALDGESVYQSPTVEHLWVKVPVLTLTASPSGTSGEVGSAFVVQAHLTLDNKPLRDTEVHLTSTMSGQATINRTATSDATGSASFTYTRQTPGLDRILVTASWQGRASGSDGLSRRWTPASPPTSPTPTTPSPTTPTPSTATPSVSSPTVPESPGSSVTPRSSTPTETPTPIQASLDLSPDGVSTTVGRDFTVTATLSTSSGDPVPDRSVTFETTKSGEAAISRTISTDREGNARFIYRRSATGSDTVVARVTVDGTALSERVRHQWVDRATPPEGTLRLDSGVVNPGSDLKLSGSGCPANGSIELSIGDVPIAATRADGAGDYHVVAPLPQLPLGRHKIKARCALLTTTATVDVVGVTAAMGTAGAAGVTTVAVLAFFVLLGGSIVRGLGNLGTDLPFG